MTSFDKQIPRQADHSALERCSGRLDCAYLVDLALGDVLDQWVLGNFTGNASVATADDEYLFWVGMDVQRNERDHLLVGELVELGALDAVVQDEHVSERFAFNQKPSSSNSSHLTELHSDAQNSLVEDDDVLVL